MIEGIDFAANATALFVESRDAAVSYRELARRVDAARGLLAKLPRPALAFQFVGGGEGAVAFYLACLAEKIPIGLGEPAVAARDRVIATYAPTVLSLPENEAAPSGYEPASPSSNGIALWHRSSPAVYPVAPHPALAVLLATSGSTGEAKFVRLSWPNLLANARSIAAYLELRQTEVAIQSLPFHYSFGLSVLNSHLVAGASVAITRHSFMRPEFWCVVDECGVTSFAGVPYMYETLHRLRMAPTARPALRTLTQAGGHMKEELVRHFSSQAKQTNGRLFVMYGQTEASPRIAYVPPERLDEKVGSIGIAIPGGELWLEPAAGDVALSELHYRGPNVMLGYATGPADLARGDDQGGVLATGDLAERDDEGFFRITGRLARFAKLFGKRINLAGLETEVETRFAVRAAAIDGGDHLHLFLEGANETEIGKIRAHLAAFAGIPPPAIKSTGLSRIPLTPSGKKDYKVLT